MVLSGRRFLPAKEEVSSLHSRVKISRRCETAKRECKVVILGTEVPLDISAKDRWTLVHRCINRLRFAWMNGLLPKRHGQIGLLSLINDLTTRKGSSFESLTSMRVHTVAI